ncbi:DUF2470 domain-containing protein [Micromonospora sp. HNM0581]|uniref:DUF2470 domain-containing protein n=1 Tax=Micromonospora sp. HNM0581 TaxID=2716341 RepID=UPI00146A2DC9|nr:DUF2470 domain-containing protein [Micromonospora sp. HNM0581]NLU78482.1 DUF2470 domain-containing protein [Micromonospora sp. HNM0581]
MAFHPAGRPADLTPAAPAVDGSAAAGGHADAVLARSALSTASSLRLHLDDTAVDLIASHALLPDGTVVLAVDAMTPTGGLLVAARGRPGATRIDVTHLIPVAARSRVRAKIYILGTARRFDPASLDFSDSDTAMSLLDLPPVALWAVEPVRVGLTHDGADTTIGIGAYRTARPDPLAAAEAGHLQHLQQRHGDLLGRLANLLDPALTAASTRILPVAVDADGIVLRAEEPHRHTDVRLTFRRRAASSSGLAEELRTLLAQAAPHRQQGSVRAVDPQRTAIAACRCDLHSW